MEYSNRQKKKDAYAILLDKYRNRYPEANREYVTKKCNSLRANFKKDTKRIDNSEKNWRRYRKCFVFFFAFTQKLKAMATQAASVSLIMSEPQLMIAQRGYWPRPTSFILHLGSPCFVTSVEWTTYTIHFY
jgi:transketolase